MSPKCKICERPFDPEHIAANAKETNAAIEGNEGCENIMAAPTNIGVVCLPHYNLYRVALGILKRVASVLDFERFYPELLVPRKNDINRVIANLMSGKDESTVMKEMSEEIYARHSQLNEPTVEQLAWNERYDLGDASIEDPACRERILAVSSWEKS